MCLLPSELQSHSWTLQLIDLTAARTGCVFVSPERPAGPAPGVAPPPLVRPTAFLCTPRSLQAPFQLRVFARVVLYLGPTPQNSIRPPLPSLPTAAEMLPLDEAFPKAPPHPLATLVALQL